MAAAQTTCDQWQHIASPQGYAPGQVLHPTVIAGAMPPPLAGETFRVSAAQRLPCKGSCRRKPAEGCIAALRWDYRCGMAAGLGDGANAWHAPLHADIIQYIISDAPAGRNFAKSSKLGCKNRPEPLDGFGIIVLAVWAADC